MKKMSREEAKVELIKMLSYFNDFCRKNNIEYSLIGGSLIGTIRHKGMIPWDDDIDVILTRDNYIKLKNIFNEKTRNKSYILYSYEYDASFYFPFMKLINLNTYVEENNSHKKIPNYGLFIDIFCYTDAPDNEKERIKYFKKIRFCNSLLSITSPLEKKISLKVRILRIIKNIIVFIIGEKNIHKLNNKLIFHKKETNGKYVVSNWPVYSYDKEVQIKNDTLEYVDSMFDGVKVRIFKNYDNILKRTFGKYMEVPPVEKRVNHDMNAYWRNIDEEK